MKNIEVKEWLCRLNKEDYIDNLQRLENIVANSRKIEIKEKIVYKNQEKQAGKTIKRILRKIKQR